MSRPQKISYDDILADFGVYVKGGQLHSLNRQPPPPLQHPPQPPPPPPYEGSGYIHEKYFKSYTTQPIPQRPRTLLEYRNQIIADREQQQRIAQIKSKKIPLLGHVDTSSRKLTMAFDRGG